MREKKKEEGDFQPRAPGFLLLPRFTYTFPPLPEGYLFFIFILFILLLFFVFYSFKGSRKKVRDFQVEGGGVKMSGRHRLIEMSK